MLKINLTKKPKFIVALSLGLFFFYYYLPFIMIPYPMNDCLRFITIDNIPGVYSINYIFEMFLKYTNGPQYRPLSFFVYQLFTKTLFGSNMFGHYLMPLLFNFISAFLIYKILKAMKYGAFLSLAGSAIFLLNSKLMVVIGSSLAAKYPLPLMMLLLGYYICYKANRLDLKMVLLLVCVQSLSLMMHEGSLVFSFIWIEALRLDKSAVWSKVLSKKLYIIMVFLPTIIYLFIRFIINSAPKEGFMKVGVDSFLSHFLNYLKSSWYLLKMVPGGNYFHWAILLGVTIFAIWFLVVKNNHRPCSFIACTVILIAPFCLLPNHYISTRSFWSYPFFSFLVVSILGFIKTKVGRTSFAFVAALLLFLVTVTSLMERLRRVDRNSKVTALHDKFLEQYEEKYRGERNVMKLYVSPKNQLYHKYYSGIAPASLIATYAKLDHDLFLDYKNEKDQIETIYIRDRALFFVSKQVGKNLICYDLFYNEHHFNIASSKMIKDLPYDYTLSF